MRSAYLETLYDLAQKDKNVFALISDNGAIVYDKYRKDLPEQYINAGISEANMVGMAAGMASRGKIPFAYTIGAFLAYRAYEFILNDVCLQNENVKLVGIGAGGAYSLLGPSHHTIFDLALLRPLPNLTVFSPASPMEVKKVVNAAYEINGPVYIRLGTNREPEIYFEDYNFVIGHSVQLRDGNDLTLISTGSILADVLQAADELEKKGISTRVLNVHTIKPFYPEMVLAAARETGKLITIEEHSVIGGLGSMISEAVAEAGLAITLKKIGLHDFVKGYGTHNDVKKMNGLSMKNIIHVATSLFGKE